MLKFSQHPPEREELLHKLSPVGFLMRKLSYVLSINNLKSVYYAYYHSLVKYGIIYWGNTPDCRKVFLMQKKIIKIMMGVQPTHTCCDLFKKLEILPIPCVYLLSLMTFVVNNYKFMQITRYIRLALGIMIIFIYLFLVYHLIREVYITHVSSYLMHYLTTSQF
jgi:hypothetical protein